MSGSVCVCKCEYVCARTRECVKALCATDKRRNGRVVDVPHRVSKVRAIEV